MINVFRKIKNKIVKYILEEKIRIFFKKLWLAIYKSIFTFDLHAGYETSGYLAFTIIFALFPFMIFFTLLISYFGQTEIGIKLLEILEMSLPTDIKKTLLPVIDNVIHGSKIGIISLATLTLIWTASSLIQGLKIILDKAYRIVKTNNNSGIKAYLFGRFGSIMKFLFITILIILAIFFTIICPKILIFINKFVPIDYNYNVLTKLKPLLLMFFMFVFVLSINYIIPSRQQKMKFVIPGSILTTIGWFLSIKVLTFYLTKVVEFQAVYGSLAGIIITLFFFHIMTIILIFGAEFNYNLKDVFKMK